MRRRKAIVILLCLSIACPLLSETGVPSICAAEETYGLVEAEISQRKGFIEERNAGFANATESNASKEDDSEKIATISQAERELKEENVLLRLQVPEKFNIVLDPWQMDRKEQIFSEEYTIKNTSREKGILKLTGIAVGGKEGVEVCLGGDNINDGNGQNIFIEMVINSKDRLTLLPEGADYEIILEADTGVTVSFTGEMNENAEEGWHDSDVKVEVVYDWVTESEEGYVEMEVVSEEYNTEGKGIKEEDGRK